MQAELDAVFLARGAHARCAPVIESGERVGRGIELDVDEAHRVLRRPLDAVLELRPASDVDPYSDP